MLLASLNGRGFRLVMVADALVLVAVMVGTNLVRFGWDWPTYPKSDYLLAFLVATCVHLPVFYFGGLYEREPRLGAPPALPRVARLTLVSVLLVAAVVYATSGTGVRVLPTPAVNLLVLLLAGTTGVVANRRLAHYLRLAREGPPRVLLVGAPDEVNVAREHLQEDPGGAVVAGETSSHHDLTTQARRSAATEVLLLSSRWLDSLYPDELAGLERLGVPVLQRVTAKETLFGLEGVREVGGMPFVLLRTQTLPRSRKQFKRFTELALLLAAAPVLLPLTAVMGVYHLVVAGRPVLFRQERIGQDGVPFAMLKFRTMRLGAEEDGSPRLASRDDPRILPGCRWVRAMRLDELPQVWNVLRGEMALVGPRPERPLLTEHFEELIPGYARRYEIPPGITGLAQVLGRYDTDPEYKLGYDLQHLVNWSPLLDLQILLRTAWVVLTRRV